MTEIEDISKVSCWATLTVATHTLMRVGNGEINA